MLLLKITEANWNRLSPGSWEKTKWKINSNGAYSIAISFYGDRPGDQPTAFSGRISAERLEKLKTALKAPWSDEPGQTDGNPWEFKAYKNGTVDKYRELGYIRGIDALETIVELLPRDYDVDMVDEELVIDELLL